MLRPALALAALVAVALLPSAPAAAGPPDDLRGTWVLAQEEDEVRTTVDAAIDHVVSRMFAGFRGIARPQLRKWARWCGSYTFHVEVGRIEWSCDGRRPVVIDLAESTTVVAGEDGAEYGVEAEIEPLGVRVVYTGRSGGQRDFFRVDDRGTLVVTRAMFSKRLPEDLVWTLRYTKR